MGVRPPLLAAYEITHVASGKMYVGSAKDFFGRMRVHKSSLKLGTHKNVDLQAAFNIDPEIEFSVTFYDTREEAYDHEQALLDEHHPKGELFNVAVNARSTNKDNEVIKEYLRQLKTGTTHTEETKAKMSANRKGKTKPPRTQEHIDKLAAARTGSKHSEESIAKIRASSANARPVSIDGVVYPSISEASRSLGVEYKKIKRRIKSTKHKTWLYA